MIKNIEQSGLLEDPIVLDETLDSTVHYVHGESSRDPGSY